MADSVGELLFMPNNSLIKVIEIYCKRRIWDSLLQKFDIAFGKRGSLIEE